MQSGRRDEYPDQSFCSEMLPVSMRRNVSNPASTRSFQDKSSRCGSPRGSPRSQNRRARFPNGRMNPTRPVLIPFLPNQTGSTTNPKAGPHLLTHLLTHVEKVKP